MSESATGCVVRGLLVEGSSGEGEALPAAMRAATRHAPFLLRQLAHFSSFGASRGHVPSFLAASLRFIGAKRPFAPQGYLPAAQLRTQGITEMGGNSRHSCVRTFRRSGARHPSLCATQTMNADVAFKISPFESVFFRYSGTISERSTASGEPTLRRQRCNRTRPC